MESLFDLERSGSIAVLGKFRSGSIAVLGKLRSGSIAVLGKLRSLKLDIVHFLTYLIIYRPKVINYFTLFYCSLSFTEVSGAVKRLCLFNNCLHTHDRL